METISDEDIDALSEWLKSYPKLTKGNLTLEFEKLWAEYIGTKYAVFCNSGSSANLLMVYAALHDGLIGNKRLQFLRLGGVQPYPLRFSLGLSP